MLEAGWWPGVAVWTLEATDDFVPFPRNLSQTKETLREKAAPTFTKTFKMASLAANSGFRKKPQQLQHTDL